MGDSPQNLFQRMIRTLGLAIFMRVIPTGHTPAQIHGCTKGNPKTRQETHVPVGEDAAGKPMQTHNLVEEMFRSTLRSVSGPRRNEVHHLGRTIGDRKNAVEATERSEKSPNNAMDCQRRKWRMVDCRNSRGFACSAFET